MKIRLFLSGMLLTATTAVFAAAGAEVSQQDQAFSPQQVKSIETIIREYLVSNPEVLLEASDALRVKMEQEQESKTLAAIKANQADLFDAVAVPFAGNPQGTQVMVEFFDYQCPHCKEMKTAIANLLTNNPNLKIIFRDWPIFGGASLTAAKAALAANRQGQYFAMHEALLAASNPLTDAKIDKIAASLNLNLKKLKKDMQDPAVMDEINATFALSKKLGLSGTPVFVVANQARTAIKFVPGSTSEQKLQQLLDDLHR